MTASRRARTKGGSSWRPGRCSGRSAGPADAGLGRSGRPRTAPRGVDVVHQRGEGGRAPPRRRATRSRGCVGPGVAREPRFSSHGRARSSMVSPGWALASTRACSTELRSVSLLIPKCSLTPMRFAFALRFYGPSTRSNETRDRFTGASLRLPTRARGPLSGAREQHPLQECNKSLAGKWRNPPIAMDIAAGVRGRR
jgi:hypothetical protein